MSEYVVPETQEPKQGYVMSDATACIDPAPVLESSTYKAAGKLKGKTALITGGDSGIGAAVAIAFAKEGADVAVSCYDENEDAETIAARIQELGQKALIYCGDVGDETFAQETVADLVGRWGKLDVLVNNAGEQTPCESILELEQAQIVRTFQSNIFSMFYLVKAALPHMPKGGTIINTSSVTAFRGSPNLLDYSATKGAIVAFTRSLAKNAEILEMGIRVNAIAPGPIWTPLNPASYGPDAEKVRHFGEKTPLGRAGEPYELAAAYVYLACEDSSYTTGEVIHINGGDPM